MTGKEQIVLMPSGEKRSDAMKEVTERKWRPEGCSDKQVRGDTEELSESFCPAFADGALAAEDLRGQAF